MEKPNYEDYKFRNDRFRKERGGQAAMIEIDCGSCGELALVYQKDGYPNQHLYRCYVDRIFYPPEIARLNREAQSQKDLPELLCRCCGTKIGTPMTHKEGRLAFGLLMGNFTRKKLPNQRRFGK